MGISILSPLLLLVAVPDPHAAQGVHESHESPGARDAPAAPDAAHPTAQDTPPPACLAQAAPTGEFAAWMLPGRLSAAGSVAQLGFGLELGKAANVRLMQVKHVSYALRPEKPGIAISYGGLVPFDVVRAGTYRIALAAPAWIDVVRGGRVVTATAHSHGPDCTGIRKLVDFQLTPGRHTLQLSGSNSAEVRVMIVRAQP